jgi:hypothetical protein
VRLRSQRRDVKAERMQRLAEIVARGGQQLAFRPVGGLCGRVITSLTWWPNARTKRSTTVITTAVNTCTWSPRSATRTISGTSAGSTNA